MKETSLLFTVFLHHRVRKPSKTLRLAFAAFFWISINHFVLSQIFPIFRPWLTLAKIVQVCLLFTTTHVSFAVFLQDLLVANGGGGNFLSRMQVFKYVFEVNTSKTCILDKKFGPPLAKAKPCVDYAIGMITPQHIPVRADLGQWKAGPGSVHEQVTSYIELHSQSFREPLSRSQVSD